MGQYTLYGDISNKVAVKRARFITTFLDWTSLLNYTTSTGSDIPLIDFSPEAEENQWQYSETRNSSMHAWGS